MYRIELHCPGTPSVEALEAAIEAVVVANTDYFLREWSQGREPPCCLGCAEIRYVPAQPSTVCRVLGAEQVLRQRAASCQSAAAYFAGRERALALEKGVDPDVAAAQHRVQLQRQDHPDAPDGYWHAYYRGPDGLSDVTEEMTR